MLYLSVPLLFALASMGRAYLLHLAFEKPFLSSAR
jgi:hypothetical protein